jgi:hypothetical protein
VILFGRRPALSQIEFFDSERLAVQHLADPPIPNRAGKEDLRGRQYLLLSRSGYVS